MLRTALVRSLAAVALVSAGCASLSAFEPTASSNPPISAMAQSSGTHRSTPFTGPKANKGFATQTIQNGRIVLTLSDDFVIPDTPAPHWQLVDSAGNVYLLNRLKIKDDKYNQTITAPTYVKDVAKVQIWCSWAEALLGEATLTSAMH